MSGGYYLPEGLDIPDVLRYLLKHDLSLADYAGAKRISNEELLALDVEVLIPAAIGGVLTADNAGDVKADVIIEAANGPTLPEADETLYSRGAIILPDILANAGGVTASYFEWVQNHQYYRWDLNRVRQELDHILSESFERVWEEAAKRNVSLRTAAYIVGIGRVGRATILGGSV